MISLAPTTQHPLYWALTNIVGMSRADIARHTGISLDCLTRLEHGYTPTPIHRERLRKLLERRYDQLYADSPDRKDQPAEFRALYTAMSDVVTYLRKAYQRDPTKPLHTETNLSTAILANLGTRGARVDLVIARVKVATHSTSTSIRRTARRIGVRTITDAQGYPLWLPPKDLVAITPTPPKPQVIPASTPRQLQLRLALVKLLEAAKGSALARDVVTQLRLQGFSPASIYRAARDANILRRHSGFGPTRQTLWELNYTPSKSS